MFYAIGNQLFYPYILNNNLSIAVGYFVEAKVSLPHSIEVVV